MRSRRWMVLGCALSLLTALLVVLPGGAASAVATALSVTPTAPMAGERVVVSGQLSTHLVRPVSLQHQVGTSWPTLVKGVTSSTGAFSFPISVTAASSSLRVSAPSYTVGGQRYVSTTSTTRLVTVVGQTATVSLPSQSTSASTKAVLSFTPVRPGRAVQLQVVKAGVWTTVASAVQDASGHASVTVATASPGSFSYRAQASAASGAPAKVSSAVVLVVPAAQTAGWQTVSTGYSSACGLKIDRSAWCWGSNFYGELGDGTLVNKASPTRLSGGGLWASLAVGSSQACGVRTDGSAWCWGRNDYGELGDGTNVSRKAPVKVVGGKTWTSVSSGFHHTCGIQTDGSAWCWGWVGLSSDSKDRTTVPVRIGTNTWTSLSAGLNFTCGVRTDGSDWCWGSNGYYNLGNGTATSSATPVAVSTTGAMAGISAGELHACGRRADLTAWCWGLRARAVGDDDPDDIQLVPTLMSSASWTVLSSKGFHNCGVQTAGSAWCWGPGAAGQLGNGSLATRQLPTRVSGTGTWTTVSTGEDFACGVKSDHTAWCWGTDTFGQLGLGDARVGTDVSTPLQVLGTSGATALVAVTVRVRRRS